MKTTITATWSKASGGTCTCAAFAADRTCGHVEDAMVLARVRGSIAATLVIDDATTDAVAKQNGAAMTGPELLRAVAATLTRHGFHDVTVEHPGVVSVWAEDLVGHPDHRWVFGTANVTWQGDLTDGTGAYLGQTLDTGIDSREWNPDVVSAAIERVLTGGGEAYETDWQS